MTFNLAVILFMFFFSAGYCTARLMNMNISIICFMFAASLPLLSFVVTTNGAVVCAGSAIAGFAFSRLKQSGNVPEPINWMMRGFGFREWFSSFRWPPFFDFGATKRQKQEFAEAIAEALKAKMQYEEARRRADEERYHYEQAREHAEREANKGGAGGKSRQDKKEEWNRQNEKQDKGNTSKESDDSSESLPLREKYLVVLGLAPYRTYTKEQIKKAYRRQSMKHHPDRGGSHEQFVVLQEAYDYLYKNA